jgi:PAS domain S-box-containing protein
MRSFRDRPIKQKLMLAIMATTAAALVVAGLGMVLTDSLLFRRYLERDLSALAKILADNTTAALEFDDPKSAAETLGALRARPHVIGACVYRSDGEILASYMRAGSAALPPFERANGIRFAGEGVTVSQPIVLSGREIGKLILFYDLREISERITLYGLTVSGVLLASALLAFLISSRLRRIVEAPISALVRAATSVAETGDYSTRAEKVSGDELGFLVDRFNEMLAGIHSRDEQLKRERERFRFMAESMPQKIFTATPGGRVDYLNRQWMEFTGLSLDRIMTFGWGQFAHPDDVEQSDKAWRRAIETGEPFHAENRFRRADGKYRWHLNRAHAMRDAEGEISIWVGSSTDIHERKEEEEALRRANNDLQQFAYAASHDLQEPIRNVAVYSELVADRYHDLLDEDGRLFLGFLKEGGRRLARLVNDLLAYTRASAEEITEGPVDSTSVLKHSLSALSEAVRESGGEVTYDPLPEVYMGEAHLQQVLQNVISNALKYRNRNPPRIHVSAVAEGAEWRFAIKDNGIGIDPQYKEKIFGVFKRLHHDRTYGGTGIGLAICKRVVERYGGQIWVDSEPGRGSTFYFTLPRRTQTGGPPVESSAGGG